MKCYDEYASEYDAWFMKNSNLLMSEVKMIAKALDGAGEILSVGCGSGLMESLLQKHFKISVKDGIEPSSGMAEIARRRGMNVISATAEDFKVGHLYDTALLNGCPSYIENLDVALANVAKAVKPGGMIVLADVPKESAYALVYNLAMTLGTWNHPLLDGCRPPHPYPIEFVKAAKWRTTLEKLRSLVNNGFFDFEFCQTLTMHPFDSNRVIEDPISGFDRGSYVAVRARRIPFLEQLKDGTLPRAAFDRYVTQDAFYLRRYAEALRLLAEKLDREEDKKLVLNYAEEGIAAEQSMIRDYVPDVESAEDEGWGKEMLDIIRQSPAALGVAAVYPCFRLFADAGKWLQGCGGPYAKWVETYSGPDFRGDAEKMKDLLHRMEEEYPEYQPAIRRTILFGGLSEIGYWKSALAAAGI